MKKLKEPKTFKKPRAYYLDMSFGRLRIIYPNGKTEVSGEINSNNFLGTFQHAKNMINYNYGNGCWAPISGKFKNGHEALEAMRAYDAKYGRRRAIYLGEF